MNFFRIVLSSLLLISFFIQNTLGAEVYVDANNGNDTTGDGTFKNPWKTIKTAAVKMNENDICLIRAGVYRETIKPKNNQIFKAYENEFVLISGCDIVTDWSLYKGNTYKSVVKDKVRQLFVNEKEMYRARYPDEDGDMYSKNDFTPTYLNRGKDNWGTVSFNAGLDKDYTGGFLTSLNGWNAYQAHMGIIEEQNGDSLKVVNVNHRWNYSGEEEFHGRGHGFITDHLNALTSEKEWHWQNDTLYFYPNGGKHPSKSNSSVEARTRLWGFDCSQKSNVQIRGLNFFAASVLMDESHNSVIDSCTFRYVSPWGKAYYIYAKTDRNHYNYGDKEDGTSGIHISGSNNVIQNCYVAYGWGALISLRGHDNIVQNNYIEECNWQMRQDAVGVILVGSNQKILNNTLRKSTSMLISLRDIDRVPIIAPVIKHNDLREYGYVMKDGGTAAIYYNGNSEMQGGEFAYNYIDGNRAWNNRVSAGIYLDDGSYNATIHHNIILGGGSTRNAFFTHKGHKNIRVYHNTFLGYSIAGWQSAVWKGHKRETSSMIYRNNLSSGRGFSAWGVSDPATEDHNREYALASEFKDTKNKDFRIVEPNSSIIDAGVLIPGINDDFTGNAPDIGAIESGIEWRAGSTIKKPLFPGKK